MTDRAVPRVAATLAAAALVACAVSLGAAGIPERTETLVIRGQGQTIHTYGVRGGGDPIVVSSGDGGWIHLGPHIAEMLSARGFFVVGFDVKGYLSRFTSSTSRLRPEDVPGDYRVLLDFAAGGSATKPVLVGVSEGAGLSVLAASDARIHATASGVVGVGLPVLNELGWRWRDSLIYVTHGVPDEPMFSTATVIARVSPLPLASIHSTHDEYVSAGDEQQLLARAADPKRLWMVAAADHRFSDNLGEFDARLLDAITWIRERVAR